AKPPPPLHLKKLTSYINLMRFRCVCLADAPMPIQFTPEVWDTLPPSIPPHTLFLTRKPLPGLPHLRFNPQKATRYPLQYYDPQTLTLPIALKSYRAFRKQNRQKHWRNALLQKAPSIFYLTLDKNLRIQDFNPAMHKILQQIFGSSPKRYQSILPFVSPENKKVFLQDVAKVLEKRIAIQDERKIGPEYVQVNLIPLVRGKNTYVGCYALAQTALYQTVIQQIQQENLYRTILHNLEEVIVVLDARKNYKYVSPAFERSTGYRAEEVMGKNAFEAIPSPIRTDLEKQWDELIHKPNGTQHASFIYLSKQGEPLHYEATAVNLLHDPILKGILVISREVTQQQKFAQRVSLLEQVLNAISVGIAIHDTDKVLYANKQIQTYFPPAAAWEDISKKLSHKNQKLIQQALQENRALFLTQKLTRKRKTQYLEIQFLPVTLHTTLNKTYWTLIVLDQTQTYETLKQQKLWEKKQSELIVESQEAERSRIAAELHDSIGMSLSVMKLHLSQALHHLRDLPPSHPAHLSLHTIQQILDETTQNVRYTARQLMPSLVEDFGLSSALRDLIRRISHSGEIQVFYHEEGKEPSIPKSIRFHLYRIAQELIHNALKHAQATEIHVKLAFSARKITLTVSDNGKGIPSRTQWGLGLQNIHTRLDILGGNLSIYSAPDAGTQVDVSIPM
ncbi:MAG: PAS domain-containing sensor histidine kinase, partial [Bacteroidia bacterium]